MWQATRNRSRISQKLFSSSTCALSTKASSAALKGMEFEENVALIMNSLGCKLLRTSCSKDGGLDHQGTWVFPDMSVSVVTQCKHEKKPVGVQYMRAFDGVLNAFPPNVLGIFFSSSGYSIYAHRYFVRMHNPAVICTLEDKKITAFLPNCSAQEMLPKLTVGTRYQCQKHALVLTYGDQLLGII